MIENPDILIGHNIFGFDENYIYKRAFILNSMDKDQELMKLMLALSFYDWVFFNIIYVILFLIIIVLNFFKFKQLI